MPEYRFTLILDGVSEISTELEDALFEAGCDDALLGGRDGVLFLDFDRVGDSLEEVLVAAIRDVESISAGLSVDRIEPDDLVTIAEAAQRLGRTRESVRLWVAGKRGPGSFPTPVSGLQRRMRLWRWAEILSWAISNELVSESRSPVEADTIAAVNAALQLRRFVPDRERGGRMLAELYRSLGRLRLVK